MVVVMSPIVGRWVGGLVQTEPCFAGEQATCPGRVGSGPVKGLTWHILQWIGHIAMMCRHRLVLVK